MGKFNSHTSSFLLSLLLFFCMIPSVSAENELDSNYRRNWSDLDEHAAKRMYGSEREEKFPVRNPLIRVEDWEGHYSFHFSVIYKYTNYPRFKSHRFLLPIAPLFYRLTSKVDNRKKTWLFPIFYSKKEGNHSKTITPLGFSDRDEKEWDASFIYFFYFGAENRDGKKIKYHSFVPFYLYNKSEDVSDAKNKRKTSRLISPFVLYRNDRKSDGKNEPERNFHIYTWLAYYNSMRSRITDGDSVRQWNASFLYLFYAGKSRKTSADNNNSVNKYSGLVPLYYYRSWKNMSGDSLLSKNSSYISIIGSHKSFSSYKEKKLIERRNSTITIPYVSIYDKNCEEECRKTNSLRMLPAVPFLYYSRTRSGDTHRNLLMVFDWKTKSNPDDGKKSLKRFWFIPVLFAGSIENKKMKYFHILPPLIMNFWDADKRLSAFFPIYGYWRKGDSKGIYTILFQYHKIADKKHIAVIYPLFHLDKDSSGLKKLWMVLSYYKKDSYYHFFPVFFSWKDETRRTVIAPAFFSRDTPAKKMRLYGPVWKSSDNIKKTSFFHVLPLLYNWRKNNDDPSAGTVDSARRIINPLFYYGKKEYNNPSDSGDVVTESKFLFPLLPVYSRSMDSRKGINHKVLYVFDYTSDVEGKMSRLWFFPVFYKRSAYFHVFPFFFRPYAKDAPRGVSFGPIHYHRWSPEEEKRWIFIHYGHFRKNSDNFTNHYFPFYYSWKSEYSRGKVFVPAYLEYEDKNKFIKLVAVYWNKKSAGYIDPSVDVGRIRGRWYLDGDASILYNLFSIHTRVSVVAPDKFEGEKLSKPDLDVVKSLIPAGGAPRENSEDYGKDEKGRPLISKKEGIKRENANFYYGWDALFGMVSYARSDTKRHFRLLPLGWFTWDTASDNRITLFPPFLPVYFHYNSDDLEYKVAFPFYGKQRKGKSYIKSYLFIAFLSEYDEEEDMHEYSILWPLINFYKSPERSGSRFIPFYHYRNVYKDNERKKSLITPLYFRERTVTYSDSSGENNVASEKNVSISPLHYSEVYKDENKIHSVRSYPIVPIFFRKNIMIRPKKEKQTGYLHLTGSTDANAAEYVSVKNQNYFFPFYYFENTFVESERLRRRIFFAPILPLVYSEKNVRYKKDSFSNEIESEDSIHISPLKYTHLYKSGALEQKSRAIPLLPIFYQRDRVLHDVSAAVDDSGAEKTSGTETMVISGKTKTDSALLREHLSYFFPIYFKANSLSRQDGVKKQIFFAPFLPLFYREYNVKYKRNTDLREVESEDIVQYSPFHYSHHFKNDNVEQNSRAFPLLPIFYRKNRVILESKIPEENPEESGRTETALRKAKIKEQESYFFPFYYSRTIFYNDAKEKKSILLVPMIPVYAAWSNESGDSRFIAGLHLFRGKDGSRKTNFLYMFESEKNINNNYRHYDLLLRTVHYRKINQSKQFRFLYGAGVNYKKNMNSGDYRFDALLSIYGQKKAGNSFSLHLFPLIFYKKKPAEFKLFTAGLYLKKNPYERRQNFLFLYDHSEKYGTAAAEDCTGCENSEGDAADRKIRADHNRYSLLLDSVRLERKGDVRRFKMAWGLVLDYQKNINSPDYNASVLAYLGGVRKRKNSFRNYLIPVYFYQNEKNSEGKKSKVKFLFPALPFIAYYNAKKTYGAENEGVNSKQMLLLGALWYKNQKIVYDENHSILEGRGKRSILFLGGVYYNLENFYEKKARSGILWGLVYSYNRKPLRGFESRGSMWGILWNYETEKETGFKRFTLLKFVYSKTKSAKGDRYIRILGIKIKLKRKPEANNPQSESETEMQARGPDAGRSFRSMITAAN